jgi:hypothetical protein
VKTVVLSVRCSPRLLSRLDLLCQASLQTRADLGAFPHSKSPPGGLAAGVARSQPRGARAFEGNPLTMDRPRGRPTPRVQAPDVRVKWVQGEPSPCRHRPGSPGATAVAGWGPAAADATPEYGPSRIGIADGWRAFMRPARSLYQPYAAALDQDFHRLYEDECGEQNTRPK